MIVMLTGHFSTGCELLFQSQGACWIHQASHILCAVEHACAFLEYLCISWQMCGLWMSAVLQAVERLQAEATALKAQLSQSGCELAQLQEQLAQRLEEAAARKVELLGRCEELETELRDAYTQHQAAAAELKQSQAQAAEVCISPMPVYAICSEVWQPTETAGNVIRHFMCRPHSCDRGIADLYQ